jgi:hypothetical protein
MTFQIYRIKGSQLPKFFFWDPEVERGQNFFQFAGKLNEAKISSSLQF